jgi:CDP-diacylglycerol--serine O-phosphatidyltransferase
MLRNDPSHVRLRLRRPRLQRTTVNHLIPNLLTVAALCAGLTAIRFGLIGRWDLAIFAIVVAGIFDGLDGRVARLLSGGTKFGAELDSLSDFVAFGVAPAIMLYLWTMYSFAGIGWAIVLLYAVCCALRLARFNTALGDPNPPPWVRYYFTGVPAPAGAGLVLLPMMVTQEFGSGFFDHPTVNAVALVVTALLMVSRVPTFSIKQIKFSQSLFLPALLVAVLLIAALVSAPFMTFICVGAGYIASIPVAVWRQGRDRRRTAEMPLSAPSLPRAGDVPSAPGGGAPQSDRTV